MVEPNDAVLIKNLPPDLTEDILKSCFEAYGTVKFCKLSPVQGDSKEGVVQFDSVDEATWLVENLDGNLPLGIEREVSVCFKPPTATRMGARGGGKAPTQGSSNRYQPYSGPAAQDEEQSHTGKGTKGGNNGNYDNYGNYGNYGKGAPFKGGKGKGFGKYFSSEPASIKDVWKGLLRQKMLPGGTWANDERTIVVSGLPADSTDHDVLLMFSPFGAIAPGGIRVTLNDDGTAKGSGMVNFLDLESTKCAIDTLNNYPLPDGRSLRVRQFTGFPSKGKGKSKTAPEPEQGDTA